MQHLNEQQHALWQRIQSFNLDTPNVSLPFSARLARENGWATDYAVRSVHEYKKFCFLLCLLNEPLTPCDAVDQVWHLHLIYTQNYWVDWCTNILNKNIHHHPTQGGTVERDKFKNWYERTLSQYQQTFEQIPPSDIWLPTEQRFEEIQFQRINLQQYWVVYKIKWWRF